MRGRKKWKRRGCSGKIAHASLEFATFVMNKLIAHKGKTGSQIVTWMQCYQCQFCGKYHVGRTKNIKWDLVK